MVVGLGSRRFSSKAGGARVCDNRAVRAVSLEVAHMAEASAHKRIEGYLTPGQQEVGYFLAETDDEILLYHHTGVYGGDASDRPIGRARKSEGKREMLIKRLLALIKGAPA
jgi:hypothetical protein